MTPSLNDTLFQENMRCYYVDILPHEKRNTFITVLEIFLCFINGISSIIAIFANLIIIIAVYKNSSLHSNSNFLLCCLGFSDALVGLVVQPSYIASKIGELTRNFSLHCEARMLMESIGFISVGVSLCTLAVISLDMFLALYLHLRYENLVTKRRLLSLVLFVWITVSLAALLRLWLDNAVIGAAVVLGLMFNLIIIIFSYNKILKVVHRHSKQIYVAGQTSTLSTDKRRLEILKHKKFVYTMLYVVVIVLLSYIPLGCVVFVYIYEGNYWVLQLAFDITVSLTLLTSSINPVYYYFRMAEIRKAVSKTLKKTRVEDGSVANISRRAETNLGHSEIRQNPNT